MISVIIPTISGREESYERCLKSYREEADEIITVANEKNWPTACNKGAERAVGDILHFTADDLEAVPGWSRNVESVIDMGLLPAPIVWDYVYKGMGRRDDGPVGSYADYPRIPTIHQILYDRIGPWPDMDYYADVWLGDAAAMLGVRCFVTDGYYFVHHWHQHGRLDDRERMQESERRFVAARDSLPKTLDERKALR